MARKNVLPIQLLTNKSLATSFTSQAVLTTYTDNISFQINVTTTDSIGTFAVQVSNDYSVDNVTGAVLNSGTWNPLTLGGTPTVNANDTVIDISLNQVPFNAIQLAYTTGTPGTGTCNVYYFAKQIGG